MPLRTGLALILILILGPASAPALDVQGVAVTGTHLFAADHDHGLRVYDLSSPLSPVEIADLAIPGVVDVDAEGTLVALADGLGVLFVDVAVPGTPDLVGSLIPGDPVRHVHLAGDIVYVAGGHALHVIDITDPEHPGYLGGVTLALPTGGAITGLDVRGDVAYLASYRPVIGAIHTVDVSDPGDPTLLDDRNLNGAFGIAVHGNVAYVPGATTMSVVDVSNPSVILTHGSVPLRSGIGEIGEDAWIGDGYLFVAYRKGVLLFGIDIPTDPREVTDIDTQPGWATGGASLGGVSYVADGDGGIPAVALAALGAPADPGPPQGFRILAASPGRMLLRVPGRGTIEARLCDVAGRDRGAVFTGTVDAGDREIRWSPVPAAAGIYYLRVTGSWGERATAFVRLD